MSERIWKRQIQGADDLTARLFVLNIAAVIALYVLVSIVAALARFPGQETDGNSGYRHHAGVTVAGPEEAREPWVQDFVPWPYRDRVAAAPSSVASGNLITTTPNISTKVAQVSERRHQGIIGCTLSTLPPRVTRPSEDLTRF